MAINIEEKKRSIKEKRSRALQQKINLLWARDGNDTPEIQSSEEEDNFNLNQLFGGSKSSIIDWSQMGIEGLIRCYYEIVYKINGKKRNNIITNDGETPNGQAYSSSSYERSDLTNTAKKAIEGTVYKTGYFVGNAANFEGKDISSDTTNQEAARGEYDLLSSTYSHNRDKISNSSSWIYPTNDSNLLLDKLQNSIDLIGNKSSQGPHTGSYSYGDDPPNYEIFISDTILGKRFADVFPFSFIEPDKDYNSGDWEYTDGTYSYGSGSYDFLNNLTINQDQSDYNVDDRPIGYDWSYRDYYNSSLDSQLDIIKLELQSVWDFIEYTKIDYDNYFMNTNIIPGRNDNWVQQITWQSDITNIIDTINNFIIEKDVATRLELDQLIIDFKSILVIAKTKLTSIATSIDSNFGDPIDQTTMYGFRLLWIKNLIDIQNGGSKITLMSIARSIEDADKKIVQNEESYGLIGVILKSDTNFSNQKYWDEGMVSPIIGGIETHLALDQRQYLDDEETIENDDYFTMIPDGLIIAWEEIAHATSYMLWKSNDYDPVTKQGTWISIVPSGQSYTIENIDMNTGKVLSYYIDYDIDFEAEENPYYKVKTYDVGKKLSNNYWWYGTTSDYSEPQSASDFISTPSSGTSIPGMSGPPSTQFDDSISDDDAYSYLFKYATMKMGGEATDSPVNKIYTSDVEFDSVGSNLEIFVDGKKIDKGIGLDEYIILNNTEIEFATPINSISKVTMIVYFGSSSSGSGSWKSPVATEDQKPTSGNSNGDVILVLENNIMYSWDENENNWYKISDAGSSTHTDLEDMPDSNGINADHDNRYPRREEVQEIKTELQIQLDNLKYLIPENASPLGSNLEITNTQYYTGYLSGGSFNRFETLIPYQQYNKIVIGDIIIIESVNNVVEFNDADQGVISLYINDLLVDSINLANKFIENDRGGEQSWTPFMSSIIEIESIYAFNNYGQYQKCDFKLNINKNFLSPGENKIVLKHEAIDFTRESNQFIFFWDSNPTEIFFSNMQVTEKLIGTQKYLSGIRYYSLNDQFTLSYTAQSLFDNSYIQGNQIYVNGSDLGIEPHYIDFKNEFNTTDGTTLITPNVSMPIWHQGFQSINKPNICSINPELKLIGYQPYRESDEYKTIFPNLLINTYSKASDNKNEYFVDEEYRLPYSNFDTVFGNYENQWNSKTELTSGQLLVFGGKLVYPNINFNVGYLPNQTTNYSGYIGDREYTRAFVDDGIPHNNGTFMIKGDIFNDQNIKIMMKLPNQTEWLNLKKPYNDADYSGSEDDGCLLEHDGNNFTWTSGGFSTALSGYMIILRVIMSNSSANPIEEISINW